MRSWLIVLMFCILAPALGCNLLERLPAPGPAPSPTPDDSKPDDKSDQKFAETEYWDALAKLIESGRFSNSDQIVLTAESLKDAGVLSDLGRISDLRSSRVELTSENSKLMADKIRGK